MNNSSTGDPFLADCEPYFRDGVLVVAEFARRTQRVVRDAVGQQWAPLLKALGFPEKEVKRSDYCLPDSLPKANPTDGIHLGVRLKVSDLLQLAIYRYWTLDDNETGIEASIWITGRENLDRLRAAMDGLPDPFPAPENFWASEFWPDSSYGIYRVLAEAEIPQLDSRLEELISYFINLLTKVGGARKFLK